MERILCVIGKIGSGGVERMSLIFYRFLDKSKYQYDFIYENDSDKSITDDILNMGARAYPVPPMSKPFSYIKAVRKIIKNGNYNIIHCQTNTQSVLPLFAAVTSGVKFRILHNHSTSSPMEIKRHIIKKMLIPFCKLLSNSWCACSELSGRWMYGDRAFDSGKVTVLYSSVDTEAFAFSEEKREAVRSDWNAGDRFVIGHVGRFTSQKNHFFLIDVFSEYHKMNENSILVLCGDGPLTDKVREYVENKGLTDSVVFAGVRPDPERIYSAFDILLLPSLYEGLPAVCMEGCAAGLPMIISDRVTKECEVTDSVYFLPLNSASQWAEKIFTIEKNDREKTAAMMADGPFNVRNAVKSIEKLYASFENK